MLRRILLLACGSMVAYTGPGFAAPADGPSLRGSNVDAPANTKALLLIVHLYQTDPIGLSSGGALTSEAAGDLRDYVDNPDSPAYSSLSHQQRVDLSRVINSRPDLFSPKSLAMYRMNLQKNAELSDQDMADMNNLMSDIRGGKALSPAQISVMNKLVDKVGDNEYAFTSELDTFAQYGSLNSDMFSKRELSALRDATAAAAGLSSGDRRALASIADKNDDFQPLSSKDVAALKALVAKAPLGALNSLSPAQAIAVHQVVQNNDRLFASGMSGFNTSFSHNEAIQKSAVWESGGRKSSPNGNMRSREGAPIEQNKTQQNSSRGNARG